jgi:hypothetical protein
MTDWRNARRAGGALASRREALAALKCASFGDESARFGATPPLALQRQERLTKMRASAYRGFWVGLRG